MSTRNLESIGQIHAQQGQRQLEEQQMQTLTPQSIGFACKYIGICSDVKRLVGKPDNEDLKDQHIELCTACGHETCILYQMYDQQSGEQDGA